MQTKTVKNSFLIFGLTLIGMGIGYVNILYILPKYAIPAQVGWYRMFFDLSSLIAQFLLFGGASIQNKFYFQEEEKFRNQLLGFTTLIFCINFSVFSIFLLLFSDIFLEVSQLMNSSIIGINILLLLGVGIYGVYGLISSNLRNQKHFLFQNLYSSVFQKISVTLFFCLLGIEIVNFSGAIWGIVLLLILGLIMLVWYSNRLSKTNFYPKTYRGEIEVRKILNYGGTMFLGTSSALIISRIDTIMTAGILGLKETGVYSIALAISTMLEIPRRSVSQSLVPKISNLIANKNTKQLSSIYKESSLVLFTGVLFLFCLLVINIEKVFFIIPNGDLYISGLMVVVLLSLAKVFDALWGVNAEILVLSGLNKINIVLNILLLFTTIILNFLFITEKNGILGTAFASFLTIIIYNVSRGLILFWKFKMHPFSIIHIKLFGLLSVITGVVFLIAEQFELVWYIDVLLKTFLFLLLTLTSMYNIDLGNELEVYKSKLKSITLKWLNKG